MITPARGTPEWDAERNRRLSDGVFPLTFNSFNGASACRQCGAQVLAVDRLTHGEWHEALNELTAVKLTH